jgi:1-acyl-sn-glycerol-3-phosphate acyltransferase
MLIVLPLGVTHKSALFAAKYWSGGIVLLLKYICGVTLKLEGTENLPLKSNDNNGGCMLASKHQSALETLVMFWFLPRTCYIMKKELMYIPLFGWFNYFVGDVPIDRSGGSSAMKKIIKKSRERVSQGRRVFLFPEGTRTNPGEEIDYKSSIYALYKDGLPIIPVALNTGTVWPARSLMKYKGEAIVKFLPQIESGLDKKTFMHNLKTQIESESKKLLN